MSDNETVIDFGKPAGKRRRSERVLKRRATPEQARDLVAHLLAAERALCTAVAGAGGLELSIAGDMVGWSRKLRMWRYEIEAEAERMAREAARGAAGT